MILRLEDSQSSPSQDAGSDQLNELDQLDSFGEDELIYSAESAKSITDSDLQTRQQNNHQSIQHNSYSVAVVDTEKEKKRNSSITRKTRNWLRQSKADY